MIDPPREHRVQRGLLPFPRELWGCGRRPNGQSSLERSFTKCGGRHHTCRPGMQNCAGSLSPLPAWSRPRLRANETEPRVPLKRRSSLARPTSKKCSLISCGSYPRIQRISSLSEYLGGLAKRFRWARCATRDRRRRGMYRRDGGRSSLRTPSPRIPLKPPRKAQKQQNQRHCLGRRLKMQKPLAPARNDGSSPMLPRQCFLANAKLVQRITRRGQRDDMALILLLSRVFLVRAQAGCLPHGKTGGLRAPAEGRQAAAKSGEGPTAGKSDHKA